jgi:hypothetical protein
MDFVYSTLEVEYLLFFVSCCGFGLEYLEYEVSEGDAYDSVKGDVLPRGSWCLLSVLRSLSVGWSWLSLTWPIVFDGECKGEYE